MERQLSQPLLCFMLLPVLAAGLGARTPTLDAEPRHFPDRQVIFTRPGGGEEGDHVAKLVELLDSAAPGSQVRVAVYQLDLPELARAFARAQERGVDVRILTRNYSPDMIVRLRGLLEPPGVPRRVHVFPGGFGNRNHNKFVLFSELRSGEGRVRDVVFVSSANFTHASRQKHQNTLVIVDAGLHRAYQTYWDDLLDAGTGQRAESQYDRSAAGERGDSRVYFFPRAQGDTIVDILERVAHEESDRPARVRVAMAQWRSPRIAIADRLCDLQRTGSDVQVVTRRASRWRVGSVDRRVVDRLRACGVRVMELPKSTVNLHSKYLLVDGPYRDAVVGEGPPAGQRRVVWTGSPNFTGEGLRSNDEALLEIEDAEVFARYEENFEELVTDWMRLQ